MVEIIKTIVTNGKALWGGVIITILVIILIIIIALYSAIKIKEKNPLEYSVLYPETSSDSDSLKSKGVRLVSASIVVNQHIRIKGIIATKGVFMFKEMFSVSMIIIIIIGGNKTKIMTISYEIV